MKWRARWYFIKPWKKIFPTYSVLEKSAYHLIVAISVELPTYISQQRALYSMTFKKKFVRPQIFYSRNRKKFKTKNLTLTYSIFSSEYFKEKKNFFFIKAYQNFLKFTFSTIIRNKTTKIKERRGKNTSQWRGGEQKNAIIFK